MRHTCKLWWLMVLVFSLVANAQNANDLPKWEIGFGAPIDASILQIEAGYRISDNWTLGGCYSYYLDSENGRDCGAGIYAKLLVTPEAEIPVNNWLPGIGDLIGLPETLTATTYIKPKFLLTWADDRATGAFGIGPGIQFGPLTIEYSYVFVDGGSTENPVMLKGGTVNIGFLATF